MFHLHPRIVFLRLFVPLAVLVAVGIFLLGQAEISREHGRLRSLETLQVGLGSGALSNSLESVVIDLKFLSRHSALRDAVDSPNEKRFRHFAEDLSIFSESKGFYDQLRWIDETGLEVVRVDRVNGKAVLVPKQRLQNKGQRYFFTDTFQLNPGEVFVSPLDLNIEQDRVEVPYKPMLRVATPITDSAGHKRGIVIINFYGQVLLDSFARATSATSDHAMVVNGEGYWLKSPIPQDEWGFMFKRTALNMATRFPSAWALIRSHESGQELLPDGLWTWQMVHPLVVGQRSSTGSPEPFSSSRRELEAKEYVWLAVSHLPVERWSASGRSVWRKSALMAILAWCLLGLGCWKLAHAWEAIASAEEKVRRLNIDLEQQVKDRTGELLRKVAELDKEIAERKEAENENAVLQAQLQQAQKMESLGSLAGGIAHDMNNVLGAILGLASANVESQSPGTQAHRAFTTIIKAAERGGQTVKSLLNLARKTPVEEHTLDLNTILREQMGLLEHTTLSRVRLDMDLAADLLPIQGDGSALAHAFMNLCVNAVDAMNENGSLTIRTRNGDDGWVEVQVEDTGSGMSSEVMEKALDPFFTTKEMGKGTGLGLPMVYSTVKAHQGHMEIQSRPGQGTCVKVRFPACGKAVQPANHSVEAGFKPSSQTLQVLLVDDDDLVQVGMTELLETMGHEVVKALSGEDALVQIDAGLRPDAVVLDMNMPGLGGGGTLPRLRALLPSVPVLLATGRADQTALDLARAYPLVVLLPKPFGIKELQKQFEVIGRG